MSEESAKQKELTDELEELCNVKLPEDVTSDGFASLSAALVRVQENTAVATQRAIVKVVEVAGFRRKRIALETKWDINMSRLLAEDDAVKGGKNAAEREAIAKTKLRLDFIEKEKADAIYRTAQAEMSAVDYVLACLKIAKEMAGRQLDIVQKEMDLGMISRPGPGV